VAELEEAWITGDGLRAPAALSFQLGRLRREEVKLGGQAESVGGGEEIGVKGLCSGCPLFIDGEVTDGAVRGCPWRGRSGVRKGVARTESCRRHLGDAQGTARASRA
jgi:hypothetical protein